jgi:uncharacterized OB-fold protein
MIENLAPVPDEVTQEWWDATREKRLLLQSCNSCQHAQHYPRTVCVSCGASDLEWIPSAGNGVVDSYTVVHRAPHPDLETPYVIARIRLDDGPTLLSRIVDFDEAVLACDLRVSLKWQDIPGGYRLPVFRLDHQ